MSFLSDLADLPDDELTPAKVMGLYRGRAPEEVFGTESKYDKGRLAASGFFRRSGMSALPQVMMVGNVGKQYSTVLCARCSNAPLRIVRFQF